MKQIEDKYYGEWLRMQRKVLRHYLSIRSDGPVDGDTLDRLQNTCGSWQAIENIIMRNECPVSPRQRRRNESPETKN